MNRLEYFKYLDGEKNRMFETFSMSLIDSHETMWKIIPLANGEVSLQINGKGNHLSLHDLEKLSLMILKFLTNMNQEVKND